MMTMIFTGTSGQRYLRAANSFARWVGFEFIEAITICALFGYEILNIQYLVATEIRKI